MKSLRSDERGQVVVIGFLLVVLILLMGFSIYVQTVEPSKNTNAEISHQSQFEQSMLELHSKTTSSPNLVTYQTFDSRVDYTTLGTQFYPTQSYKLSKTTQTENLTFTNTSGEQENITTTTDAFTISKSYNYISDTSYTYQHTYLSRNTTNKEGYIITPINIVDGNTITLQNVTVDTIEGKETFNVEINKNQTNTTRTITNGQIRIETSTPVSQFNEVENESTVTSVNRDGKYIVINLDDGDYTIVKQNITIET